jgi:hypothetical protein
VPRLLTTGAPVRTKEQLDMHVIFYRHRHGASRVGEMLGRTPRRLLATLGVAAVALALGAPASSADERVSSPPLGSRLQVGHRSFYVSPEGSDAASGTSPAHALRTLAAASTLPLGPGDRLLLLSGGHFEGELTVSSSGTRQAPIEVASYGGQRRPSLTGGCIELDGSWIVLTSVRVHGCRAGVLSSGQHDTVAGILADHNMYGVEIAADAGYDKVLRSRLVHNAVMAPDTPGPFDDYGADGVVVRGVRAEIAYNTFRDQIAPSPDFGHDGAAIEIFGAVGT